MMDKPVMILPYRGFGNPERAFLRGRILEKVEIQPEHNDIDFWGNLLNMYRRFESDGIPNARLKVILWR